MSDHQEAKTFKLISMHELAEQCRAEQIAAISAGTWGNWVYNPSNYTLTHRESGYEIDVEDCTNSAETLDWIMHISRKAWSAPEDVGFLVKALDMLLNIQSNICPGGQDREVCPAEIISARTKGEDA